MSDVVRSARPTLSVVLSFRNEAEVIPELIARLAKTLEGAGIDYELVGSFAAKVRSVKPPDSYKGKGIRYRGEYVRKLAGKTFGTAGT